jgi:endogenous inhibitor of DNA gyrase (YacG/DUF329 family)
MPSCLLPCPICQRPSQPRVHNVAAPFCSPRCKQVDLGKWLDATYRVPLDETTDDDGAVSGDGSDAREQA